MGDWIVKLYQQFASCLDQYYDIVNLNAALHTISIFEHINLSKEQLIDSKIVQEMQYVHFKTTNEYLKYRLEFLLQKWSNIVNIPPAKKVRSTVSNTVFEAIINDDDKFFETTSVPVLLHRLLKSFDKNYKVIDMATVLNTISLFEELDIPAPEVAQVHLVTYIRRLRHHTTNRYLDERLGVLLDKWGDVLAKFNLQEHQQKNMKLKLKLKIKRDVTHRVTQKVTWEIKREIKQEIKHEVKQEKTECY